jgi:FtsP/CotA-like multicopper oxidase with cupredoxin domain
MGREVQMDGMDHSSMNHGEGLGEEGETDGSGRVFGWASGAPWGSRVLSYGDLRAAVPAIDTRAPEREIVVRLGGNMERYIWTINGKSFEDAEPIRLNYGERARLTFINESMMAHPMHLHGMFVRIENGQPMDRLPEKTVVSVAPGKTYSALITADQPGEWAFHCHLLYHMASGMMRKVTVAQLDAGKAQPQPGDPQADHSGHRGH